MTDEVHWKLDDLMGDVLKDVPKNKKSFVQSDFAGEIGFTHSLVLHHSYTGQYWPPERRNPAYSYAQHERRNRAAREARTEDDWARIWEVPASSRKRPAPSPDTVVRMLDQLQDPGILRALRRLAADTKKARGLEEAAKIADADKKDQERVARREWARVDKERQRLEKLGANNPNDFYVQASTRLARLPMEVYAVKTMAEHMTPFMREELLKLADQVVTEVKKTTGQSRTSTRSPP